MCTRGIQKLESPFKATQSHPALKENDRTKIAIARDVRYEFHKRLVTASMDLSDPTLKQHTFFDLFSVELKSLKWNRTRKSLFVTPSRSTGSGDQIE